MTVIAADGTHIVADGRTLFGHSEIGLEDTRKIVVRDRVIYAISGVGVLLEPLIAWHLSGATPSDAPACAGEAWSFLVIDAAGPGYYCHQAPYRGRMNYPLTLGCGADYALGAMLAGADARRAVEIACSKDAKCGGEIQVIDIAEALGLSPMREAAE